MPSVYHVLGDTLAMRQDLLPRINYVQLDIFVDLVRIVQHLTLEKTLTNARQGIIVQKVSTLHHLMIVNITCVKQFVIIFIINFHLDDHYHRLRLVSSSLA